MSAGRAQPTTPGVVDATPVEALREHKANHPGALVVCYVNSSAAIKAESYICCTSANVIQVVNSIEAKEVLMTPDDLEAGRGQH